MSAAATTSVATPASAVGHTAHGAAIATAWSSNSITTRNGPGVGTNTCRLSPLVEKTDGRPTSMTTAGSTSQIDISHAAHGPAIQAMTSTENRSPEDRGVSYGWSLSVLCLAKGDLLAGRTL